jgi:hypothetical protein
MCLKFRNNTFEFAEFFMLALNAFVNRCNLLNKVFSSKTNFLQLLNYWTWFYLNLKNHKNFSRMFLAIKFFFFRSLFWALACEHKKRFEFKNIHINCQVTRESCAHLRYEKKLQHWSDLDIEWESNSLAALNSFLRMHSRKFDSCARFSFLLLFCFK